MSFLVPPRRPSTELLDRPDLPSEEMARSLEDLEAVNRVWGNARLLAGRLAPYLEAPDGSRARILDLGAGSGTISADLAAHLSRRGVAADTIALDAQWRHLAAGRARNGSRPPSVAADAFAMPFADGSADWIVSTLFFHHFSPEENALLLKEIARVARRGFALMDIRRHRMPLTFIAAAGRLAFRSRVSVEDGAASVRQSYTLEEAREIAERAVPGTSVERVFPFRLLLFKPPAPPTPVDCRLSTVDSPE